MTSNSNATCRLPNSLAFLLLHEVSQRSKNPNAGSEIVFWPTEDKNNKATKPYLSLGIIRAADCFLYSIGLICDCPPVSTFSIFCASQSTSNSFFTCFLDKQKFTPYIINSLVPLAISTTLLVFQNGSENTTKNMQLDSSFVCTVLLAHQLGMEVIKRETFTAVLDMVICSFFVCGGTFW